MLATRSGHLRVPTGKPLHRNVCNPILPDLQDLSQMSAALYGCAHKCALVLTYGVK